LLLTEEKLEGL